MSTMPASPVAPTTLRPYADMVRALFKKECTGPQQLMHAAIGIAGEVGELMDCHTHSNIKEELGDLQFYIVAAWQALQNLNNIVPSDTDYHHKLVPIGTLFSSLTIAACELLDAAKKEWVYSKPLATGDAVQALERVEAYYHQFLIILGVTPEQVKQANQLKLGKRYPEGVYSDAAAQARADKESATWTKPPGAAVVHVETVATSTPILDPGIPTGLPTPRTVEISLGTTLLDWKHYTVKRRDRATAHIPSWVGDVYAFIAEQSIDDGTAHVHLTHERLEKQDALWVTLDPSGLGHFFAIPEQDVVLLAPK